MIRTAAGSCGAWRAARTASSAIRSFAAPGVGGLLNDAGGYDRSRAETLMRRQLRAAGLPPPLTNVMLDGHLVDFLWPEHRVIVEIDGYTTHGNRQAFENDRRRDQVHVAHGYVVIRITWRQLEHEPMAVVARIAQALAHRG